MDLRSSDVLRILVAEGEAATTVRRSRFYGHAAPVADAQVALARLVAAVEGRHPDAGHVVYAWRGRTGEARSSDDGEPQGTGGRPLLLALERARLVDSAVAVARVFGGSLLGVAGLARAYGEAAALALEAAPAHVLGLWRPVSARAGWSDQAALEAALVPALTGLKRRFSADGVEVSGEVEEARTPALAQALADATAGRVRLRERGEPRWH